MTTIEQINRTERLLHAAKGRLQAIRQKRWIAENYKNQQPAPVAEIVEAETEITEHRRTLKNLYQTI